jgi:hypothetical protein
VMLRAGDLPTDPATSTRKMAAVCAKVFGG